MSDRIPLAGVIGRPVAHSASPRLHGHWLHRYGLPGQYVPLHVEPEDLVEAIRVLPHLGFVGVNVTIPHKERVLALASSVTDRAALAGAANTLTFQEGGRIHADNTDGYGFIANLRQGAPEWDAASGPAVVFGAGGAARAILAALIETGAPEIRLTNRTRPRAEQLRSEFGAKVTVHDWAQAETMLPGARTVVNTTSLGMKGEGDLRVSLAALDREAVVTDIVYTPLQTPLLQRAADHGCRTVDGLGMLLHQAAPGFERWFGHKPEVDDDLRNAVLCA